MFRTPVRRHSAALPGKAELAAILSKKDHASGPQTPRMNTIRRCGEDTAEILTIINLAAEAYRGIIPADRWHEPYMSASSLRLEIDSGVEFWGVEVQGKLLGVMGIQPVRDVDLIRHAYVLPGQQRLGVGSTLIEHLRRLSSRRMLVGTWAAASWAIDFYRRHGFVQVPDDEKTRLLSTYWDIPQRQIETSVVLSLVS
jgi:GNAT superfamily N-acetyltransferase